MSDENEKHDQNLKSESDIQRECLLVEYTAAQNSAQHHDKQVWNIVSIFWAASLVLFGFTLNQLVKTDTLFWSAFQKLIQLL